MDWSLCRGLLLDLDGTLVDTESLHMAAHRQALEAAGVPVTTEDILGNIGGHDDVFYRELQQRTGVLGDTNDWLAHKRQAVWDLVQPGAVRIMDGVLPLLGHAQSLNIPYVVVTNSRRVMADRVINAAGLDKLLPGRVCREDTSEHKPLPAPYRLGLQRLGLEGLASDHTDDQPGKSVVLAIEDSIPGVTSASSAGLTVIGCSEHHSEDRLIAAGASCVIDSLESLVP